MGNWTTNQKDVIGITDWTCSCTQPCGHCIRVVSPHYLGMLPTDNVVQRTAWERRERVHSLLSCKALGQSVLCVCVCAVLYFYVLLLPQAIFHILQNKGWPDQCKSFFVAFLGLIVCFSGNEMFIFYISQGSPRLIQTPIWGIRELTLDCIGIRNRCAYCHLLILAYILILILPPLWNNKT